MPYERKTCYKPVELEETLKLKGGSGIELFAYSGDGGATVSLLVVRVLQWYRCCELSDIEIKIRVHNSEYSLYIEVHEPEADVLLRDLKDDTIVREDKLKTVLQILLHNIGVLFIPGLLEAAYTAGIGDGIARAQRKIREAIGV